MPERTIYIGDTDHDVRQARQAGVIAVAVRTGGQAQNHLHTIQAESPDYLLVFWAEVLDVMSFQCGSRIGFAVPWGPLKAFQGRPAYDRSFQIGRQGAVDASQFLGHELGHSGCAGLDEVGLVDRSA